MAPRRLKKVPKEKNNFTQVCLLAYLKFLHREGISGGLFEFYEEFGYGAFFPADIDEAVKFRLNLRKGIFPKWITDDEELMKVAKKLSTDLQIHAMRDFGDLEVETDDEEEDSSSEDETKKKKEAKEIPKVGVNILNILTTRRQPKWRLYVPKTRRSSKKP